MRSKTQLEDDQAEQIRDEAFFSKSCCFDIAYLALIPTSDKRSVAVVVVATVVLAVVVLVVVVVAAVVVGYWFDLTLVHQRNPTAGVTISKYLD